MQYKVCFKCHINKPLDEFHKHSRMADGHLNKCGVCTTDDVRKWREKKGKQEERRERYARELDLGTRTRQRSQEEISATKDPLRGKKNKQEYYKLHYEKLRGLANARARRDENRIPLLAKRKERYWNDPTYRIRVVLSRRLGMALKNNYKAAKTMALAGATAEIVRAHIESLFQEGMSWANYGQWHIDHVIPFAAFDMSQESHQRQVCHYTNLQPLWAKDNLRKSSKISTVGSMGY